MQVSLSDVAAKAGVSAATVSRVLNGKAQGRIPESTRVRVKKVAADLQYHPNRLARGLQSRRTMNIGVVVDGLRNPLFAELLDMLEEKIIEAGYEVLPDTGRRASDAIGNGLKGWPVDGVLMWAVAHQRIDTYLRQPESSTPVVYLGHARADNADFVAHDSRQGTRLALEHLWDRGYRRIAFASPRDLETPSPELRQVAYDMFCRERSAPPVRIDIARSPDMEDCRQSGFRRSGFEAGYNFADWPSGDRPTAVFCYNDLTALGFLNGVLARGLRVPEDVAIVGFDGVDEGLYQLKALTTVEIPSERICSMALDLLLGRIAGDIPDEPRQIVLPMTLRSGATT
ncbi:MAG: LacI family DNA-binding transcriptional regulator [Capsulimonadaceae bacterium]|nr:LacI family DNA-binding transcriptional regulator [Capsulimonadaceae bacterium]